MRMVNRGDALVEFRISGHPGQPRTLYKVAPGESCDVPDGYVVSGHIQRIAPGLVREADLKSEPGLPADGPATPVVAAAPAPTQQDDASADAPSADVDAASESVELFADADTPQPPQRRKKRR